MMRRRKLVKPQLSSVVPADWSQQLREGSRTNLLRWGLHALVLVIGLGVPYTTGLLRARAIQRMYADAAACLYGGSALGGAPDGAVDDPSGRYAAMFLSRGADWPSRCESALKGLAQSPGSLRFPSVKAAEADVQKAAQLTLTEIQEVPSTQERGGKIAIKPLWGLELLRTAVLADADATGIKSSDSFGRLTAADTQAKAPTPTLLNIDAADDATLKLWGTDDELQVAAFDRRGVSYMRLTPSDTTRARLPRPGSLHSVVKQSDAAYLVWTTPSDKCGAEHCAGRSLGMAPMSVPLTKIPEPRWLAAHPFGSPARSIAWREARIWVAAAQLDGTAKLLEFDYRAAAEQKAEDDQALAPRATLLENARDLVVFADGSGGLGALGLQSSNGHLGLVTYDEARGAHALAALPPDWSSAWVQTCSAADRDGADTRYFVAGSRTEVLVGAMRTGHLHVWPVVEASVPAPARTDHDPRVALICDDQVGLTLTFVQPNEQLFALSCAPGADHCVHRPLADSATAVDVTHTRDGALVAYTGDANQPQLRVQRISTQGVPSGEIEIPGPCWERWGGMCGAPTFTWAGKRLVLAARSGANLMALETPDEGQSWSKLGATVVVQPPGPHVLPR